MTLRNLNDRELCFYKLLLLKSKVFENKPIDIQYIGNQTVINGSYLIEPLQNLFNNKIISFKNEEISDNYITAYRKKRKEFEAKEYTLMVAGSGGGSRGYDFRKTDTWRLYFTDKHCGLNKDLFDKLEKNKKVRIKIDDKIFEMAKTSREINLFFYFKFELSIDKEGLKKYLDSYLNDFIGNKFNSGEKYAYARQAQEISLVIQKLIGAGYPRESLLLDQAQIFPKGKTDVRPTDGQQIATIKLYDFIHTLIAMEKEGLLEILDLLYQKEKNSFILYSGWTWEDYIKIRIKLTDKFYQLFLNDSDVYEKNSGTEKIINALDGTIIRGLEDMFTKTPPQTKNDKLSYEYNTYGTPTGNLKIDNFKNIEFKKIPAKIVQFFFSNNRLGNSQKTFKNFNETMEEGISSNEFRLNIDTINKRVKKNTDGFVKEIIIKIKNKPQETNIYKWNEIK